MTPMVMTILKHMCMINQDGIASPRVTVRIWRRAEVELLYILFFFFFQAEDGIRDLTVTGVQTCALPILKNSLMRMQTMDAAYSGAVPNGNPFWKWDDLGPKLALYNNVFRADAVAREDHAIRETMVPPNLVDCSNNVMISLGPGAFPYSYPATFNGKTCFTILTGQVGLAYWNAAVATWTAAHPFTQQDIAAPIVSLFSPGVVGDTILTGAVTLVATAVDDVGVVGVQFQLNGQNIGAEQLVNTAYQPADSRNWDLMHKYTLSWNSAAVSNGSYLLTAVARDAAGNSTTSGGVSVTISN